MDKGFISVDDHVLEPPDLWTSRLSKDKWGDRIPHIEKTKNNGEQWVVDGEILLGGRVARVGALMADRNVEPTTWDAVPQEAYVPQKRLKAMDTAGEAYAVLFPTVAVTAPDIARFTETEEGRNDFFVAGI